MAFPEFRWDDGPNWPLAFCSKFPILLERGHAHSTRHTPLAASLLLLERKCERELHVWPGSASASPGQQHQQAKEPTTTKGVQSRSWQHNGAEIKRSKKKTAPEQEEDESEDEDEESLSHKTPELHITMNPAASVVHTEPTNYVKFQGTRQKERSQATHVATRYHSIQFTSLPSDPDPPSWWQDNDAQRQVNPLLTCCLAKYESCRDWQLAEENANKDIWIFSWRTSEIWRACYLYRNRVCGRN